MDADARGRNQWYRLRTLPSNDDAAVASVGVAGGREGTPLAGQREKTHEVHRKHGREDGL